MSKLEFDSQPSTQISALIVSFDLCAFSGFCKQPDASVVIPKFISQLFSELNSFLMGFWDGFVSEGGVAGKKVRPPDFIEFTGDGVLMIWLDRNGNELKERFCTSLVAAMRAFQTRYASLVPELERAWKIHSLPPRMRIGIACGPVCPLKVQGDTVDYAGYCINLAVRLQNHCHELGFLVHGPVNPDLSNMIKQRTVKMKGSQDEPVFIFSEDWNAAPHRPLTRKFAPVI